MTKLKKPFYIFSFVFLGLILQQFIHTAVEMLYIRLLIGNFDKYGLGLSWDDWFMIHYVGSFILLAVGACWGYYMGKYFWPRLYDENGKVRYPKPWRI